MTYGIARYEVNYTDYEIDPKLIGDGGFGEVRRGIHLATGTTVAVKDLRNWNAESERDFLREIEVPLLLNLPGVVKLLGFGLSGRQPGIPFLVMEYCPNGNLNEMIDSRHGNKLPETFGPTEFSKAIFGLAIIMENIHERNIIHRDLKPLNCIFDENNEIRIGDFGLARSVSRSTLMTVGIGTQIYQAPEIMNGSQSYDMKVDVFSYGVSLYHIFVPILQWKWTNGHLVGGCDRSRRIMKGDRYFKDGRIPDSFWGLITACWDVHPKQRPTFAEIVTKMMETDAFVLPGTDMLRYREYTNRMSEEFKESQLPPTDRAVVNSRMGPILTVTRLAASNPIYRQEYNKSLQRAKATDGSFEQRIKPFPF
jgi:serine/threonine protein kinase